MLPDHGDAAREPAAGVHRRADRLRAGPVEDDRPHQADQATRTRRTRTSSSTPSRTRGRTASSASPRRAEADRSRSTTGTPKGCDIRRSSIGVKDAVNAGQAGRIDLNVVPSTRPLASPQPDRVIAPRGKTTTVDVLANDEATNPFPGKPLRVVGGARARQRRPAGRASPSRRAPTTRTLQRHGLADRGAGRHDAAVRGRRCDGRPDRYTWGTVTVSVQDRPCSGLERAGRTRSPTAPHALAGSPARSTTRRSPASRSPWPARRPARCVSTTTVHDHHLRDPDPGQRPGERRDARVSARGTRSGSPTRRRTRSRCGRTSSRTRPPPLSSTPLDHGLRITWIEAGRRPRLEPDHLVRRLARRRHERRCRSPRSTRSGRRTRST